MAFARARPTLRTCPQRRGSACFIPSRCDACACDAKKLDDELPPVTLDPSVQRPVRSSMGALRPWLRCRLRRWAELGDVASVRQRQPRRERGRQRRRHADRILAPRPQQRMGAGNGVAQARDGRAVAAAWLLRVRGPVGSRGCRGRPGTSGAATDDRGLRRGGDAASLRQPACMAAGLDVGNGRSHPGALAREVVVLALSRCAHRRAEVWGRASARPCRSRGHRGDTGRFSRGLGALADAGAGWTVAASGGSALGARERRASGVAGAVGSAAHGAESALQRHPPLELQSGSAGTLACSSPARGRLWAAAGVGGLGVRRSRPRPERRFSASSRRGFGSRVRAWGERGGALGGLVCHGRHRAALRGPGRSASGGAPRRAGASARRSHVASGADGARYGPGPTAGTSVAGRGAGAPSR